MTPRGQQALRDELKRLRESVAEDVRDRGSALAI
jgi:hypothetical protein